MMDEVQATRLNADDSSKKSFGFPDLTSSPLYSFVSNFPKKVSEYVEAGHYFPPNKFKMWNNKESPIVELNLEKLLYAWKQNPVWVDHPPKIKVTVPKGSLCNVSLIVNVGLPPDAVYNIVTVPDGRRIFKNIKEVISRKVLVDEGLRQVVEVEQAAIWRFLWWSGTFSIKVLVDQNRKDYTMKFKQINSDFMGKFEGCWKMKPLYVDEDLCHPFKPKSLRDYISCTKGRGRIGSKLSLEQLVEPAIVLPPPISWYLRGITTKTCEMLINDLQAEAARIRQFSSAENIDLSEGKAGQCQVDGIYNIKERWAARRKNGRHGHRKFSLNSKAF